MEARDPIRIVALAVPIAGIALVPAACSTQPSHADLNKALDAYPLPESFQQVSATDCTFGDGQFEDEAKAVARYFDPGEVSDPYGTIVAVATSASVAVVAATEDDIRLERIHTTYRGANVIVFTGDNPIEVRAYGPVG